MPEFVIQRWVRRRKNGVKVNGYHPINDVGPPTADALILDTTKLNPLSTLKYINYMDMGPRDVSINIMFFTF